MSVEKLPILSEGSEIMLSLFLSLIKSPKIIGYGLLIAASFSTGVYVHSRIASLTLKSALSEQQSTLIAQCDSQKKVTEDIDHEHQAKISDLSKRVAAYKRMRPAECVHVTNTASSDNGKAGGGLMGTHDVDSESLTDYAELAEGYRLRLVSCQNFIRLERIK
jgi:ribosomal protein S13